VVVNAVALVFVEVKARASDRFGPAAAAVDRRKQRRVRIAALRWLDAHPGHRGSLRFDVVAVVGVSVEVIQAAY
jgi:putative endonuclease